MPAANHMHRDSQQVGQHRGRVVSPNRLFDIDQTQPLPELGLVQDFKFALSRRVANTLCQQIRFCDGRFVRADDDPVNDFRILIDDDRLVRAQHIGGLSLIHAAKSAHQGDTLSVHFLPTGAFSIEHRPLRVFPFLRCRECRSVKARLHSVRGQERATFHYPD